MITFNLARFHDTLLLILYALAIAYIVYIMLRTRRINNAYENEKEKEVPFDFAKSVKILRTSLDNSEIPPDSKVYIDKRVLGVFLSCLEINTKSVNIYRDIDEMFSSKIDNLITNETTEESLQLWVSKTRQSIRSLIDIEYACIEKINLSTLDTDKNPNDEYADIDLSEETNNEIYNIYNALIQQIYNLSDNCGQKGFIFHNLIKRGYPHLLGECDSLLEEYVYVLYLIIHVQRCKFSKFIYYN